MGLSGGAIAGIVIGCVVFVVLKTACEYSLFSLSARADRSSSRRRRNPRSYAETTFGCCAGMFYSFKYWYKRRQRILAARRGREKDVEKANATPLDKLAAILHLKNKGGSSTGSSSSSGISAMLQRGLAEQPAVAVAPAYLIASSNAAPSCIIHCMVSLTAAVKICHILWQ